jgi:hypothetical protein
MLLPLFHFAKEKWRGTKRITSKLNLGIVAGSYKAVS